METDPCPYCLTDVRVSWWHQVAGLATRCTRCGAFSGPPWAFGRLMLAIVASLFLNGLVLFLVARPTRALGLLIFHIATVVGLFAAATATNSEALMNTTFVAILLGPAVLSSVEFHWHAVELARGPRITNSTEPEEATSPDVVTSEPAHPPEEPRFLGTVELEHLRNDLEIAIYHQVDALSWAAYSAYALSLLTLLLAILDHQWLDTSIALLLAGIAHTARAHESRLFAVVYSLSGALLIGRFAWGQANGIEQPGGYGLPIAALLVGLGLAKCTFTLSRLRRLRRQIHMEPAAHLRD